MIFQWYVDLPWIDIPLHLMGGAWVALLFFRLFGDLFFEKLYEHKYEAARVLILAVAFSVLIGVFWEFFEYLLTQYTPIEFQGSLTDTMGDLLMDILGSLAMAYFILFYLFPKKRQVVSQLEG